MAEGRSETIASLPVIAYFKNTNALRVKLKQLRDKTVVVSASYAVEQAKVEQARLTVEQARTEIARLQIHSPWTQYARDVLPLAENLELAALEDQYQQEQAKLAIAIAELQVAKSKEQVLQQDTSAQQAELLQQLTSINEKLESLGVVRSPYGGFVKSIKWLGQTEQEILVQLTLSMAVTERP